MPSSRSFSAAKSHCINDQFHHSASVRLTHLLDQPGVAEHTG
jgi:hypothetical protein